VAFTITNFVIPKHESVKNIYIKLFHSLVACKVRDPPNLAW